jgi:hypothetical protein
MVLEKYENEKNEDSKHRSPSKKKIPVQDKKDN